MQGPGHSLDLYSATNGVPGWHLKRIAGAGSAFSAPSITTNAIGTIIAVQGPSHSLRFYWAANGSPGWHREQVAGAGTTFSAPSMTTSSNDVFIAAAGPSHSLSFYWAVDGVPGWNPEQVAGAGTTFSAPSMTTASSLVVIAAAGPSHSLQFYWQVLGAATWNPEQVAGAGTTYSAPSMTATSSDLFIAAGGASGSLRFYWQVLGAATWNPEQVAGTGTTYSAPSMTTNSAGCHHLRRRPERQPGLLLAALRHRHLEPRASGTPRQRGVASRRTRAALPEPGRPARGQAKSLEPEAPAPLPVASAAASLPGPVMRTGRAGSGNRDLGSDRQVVMVVPGAADSQVNAAMRGRGEAAAVEGNPAGGEEDGPRHRLVELVADVVRAGLPFDVEDAARGRTPRSGRPGLHAYRAVGDAVA